MSALAGTGALVRLALRRDRVLMPVWVVLMSALPLALASGTVALYGTDQARQGYIDQLGASSLLLVFYGRKPAPDLGSLIFWRSATGIVIMGLIGLLTVVRHTRVEEEAGRRELVGSAAVGRYADLTAALAVTGGASLVVAALVALGMWSQHTPLDGSIAMGLSWAAAAVAFGAVGAVAAQLSQGAGTARGLGVAVVAASFVLRGYGDVAAERGAGGSWLSWVPPLGWVYQVRAYDGDHWWLLVLLALFSAALAAAAFAVSARRDVGAGVLAPRLGPSAGAPGLRSPLALAWRLQRARLAAWTIGLLLAGAVIGGAAPAAGNLLEGNSQLQDLMERLGGTSAASDVFLASSLGFCALGAAAYGISAALRLRDEETSLRSESVLATGAGRVEWVTSHAVFALLGPAVAMAATGLATGFVYGVSTGGAAREVPRVLAGALVQLPAVWLPAALTVAVFGVLPRLAAVVGWAALAFCVLLGQVGVLLRLSGWLLDLSPFAHIPHVPGGTVDAAPLLLLTAGAAVLVALGLVGFRRRDVPVP